MPLRRLIQLTVSADCLMQDYSFIEFQMFMIGRGITPRP